MFLEAEVGNMKMSVFIVLVIAGVFISALLVVGIIKLVQILIKQVKRNKRSKGRIPSNDAIGIFGGADNILSTERQLNRISVKVVDKRKVNFEALKEMNVGAQITGNIIKCSSEHLAEALEDFGQED